MRDPSQIYDEIISRMQQSGCRITLSRRAVVAAVASAGPHFTADDVLSRGCHEHPALGRATVYRTLELCASLGLLHPVTLGDGAHQHYIVVDGGHHHLLCTRCGSSVEFEECPLGVQGHELSDRFGFEIRGHLLELYGICADCLAG